MVSQITADFDLVAGQTPSFLSLSADRPDGYPFSSATATGACTGTFPNIMCDPLVNGLNNVTLTFAP
jgi:hypothetical protein